MNAKRECDVQLLTMVLAVDCLLATGSVGFSVVSVCLAVALAVQNSGHCCGRSARIVESDSVSARARPSRAQGINVPSAV